MHFATRNRPGAGAVAMAVSALFLFQSCKDRPEGVVTVMPDERGGQGQAFATAERKVEPTAKKPPEKSELESTLTRLKQEMGSLKSWGEAVSKFNDMAKLLGNAVMKCGDERDAKAILDVIHVWSENISKMNRPQGGAASLAIWQIYNEESPTSVLIGSVVFLRFSFSAYGDLGWNIAIPSQYGKIKETDEYAALAQLSRHHLIGKAVGQLFGDFLGTRKGVIETTREIDIADLIEFINLIGAK